MTITTSATGRLEQLLRSAPVGSIGFRIRDVIGTCGGSVPLLEAVTKAGTGEEEISAGNCRVFIAPGLNGTGPDAVLDYDASLFGKGLHLSWEHCDDCQCSHNQNQNEHGLH